MLEQAGIEKWGHTKEYQDYLKWLNEQKDTEQTIYEMLINILQ